MARKPTSRTFDFPIGTLIRDAKRLLGALGDPAVGPSVASRLKKKDADATKPDIAFAPGFATQIARVEKGGTDQSAVIGGIGELTQEQAAACTELERAGKIRAACAAHAAALADHGWIADDTALLADTIALLTGGDDTQEAAKDKKQGLTAARNLAANALYKSCLNVQNAARLAFPNTRADKDETVVEARNRYLLDEFPPRGGASAGDSPDPNGPPTPPPAGK